MAARVINLPQAMQNQVVGNKTLTDAGGVAQCIDQMQGFSTQDALVASTTQTQAGGTVITGSLSRTNSVVNGSDAFTLGFQAIPGRSFTFINDGGNTCNLFPFKGDKINDAVKDAAVGIADNTCSDYYCPIVGLWFGGATTLET